MKINQHMQPEINKITKKYRNKRDQASMMKQQEEMQSSTGNLANIIFSMKCQLINALPQ